MELKPLESVMVDAVVTEARDNCVTLAMHEVFGNTHIVVRPGTVHASVAISRDRIVKEIQAIEMPECARSSVEAIINKHLGNRR